MRLNVPISTPPVRTFEGTPSKRFTPLQQLRRAVLTTLLWEDTFYESGSTVAATIAALVPQCRAVDVADIAIEARLHMHVRHVPLLLARELARVHGNGAVVADLLEQVIQRPDELTEYLAIYWKDQDDAHKESLSAGSKRGLARAFKKFDEYALAKYDRDNAITLRDVLRLTHSRPTPAGRPTPKTFRFNHEAQQHRVYRHNAGQGALWGRVVTRTLATPDTWEVALSSGADQRATWTRLITDRKLGGLAFLRNLRNMIAADVAPAVIRQGFETVNFTGVLPFRFVAAARHVTQLEDQIERAMLRGLQGTPTLGGVTALVVDTSPSMFDAKISEKSELTRFDAAAALAILVREQCESVHVWAFNRTVYEIPPRRGFALRDALRATVGGASFGGLGVAAANSRGYDRILVLTDGQWHFYTDQGHVNAIGTLDGWPVSEGEAAKVSPAPLTDRAYMVNVAPHTVGVGTGRWHSIDGWSERILDYVRAVEADPDGLS